MKRTRITVALLAACLATEARGQGQPKGPPPRVMVTDVDATGQPFLRHVTQEVVPEERQVEVVVNGKAEVRKYVVHVPVLREVRVALDRAGVEVVGTDGKRIDPTDLPKLLRQPTPVLVSADGKKVDPFYLKIAREGTLIVVSAQLAAPPPVFFPMPLQPVPPAKAPPK